MKVIIQISALIALASALVFSGSAKAGDSEKWIWSDGQGFISTATCVESQSEEITFKVSEASGKSKDLVHVKIGQTKPETADLADYIVKVIRSSKEKDLPKHIGLVRGSYWQAQMDGSKYNTATCRTVDGKAKFVMFDVFVPGKGDPVAQVGVNSNESGIFNISKVMTVKEVEEELTKPAQAVQAKKAVSAPVASSKGSSTHVSAHSSSSGPSAPAIEPKDQDSVDQQESQPKSSASVSVPTPVKAKAVTKPIPVQNVVCLHEGVLQVRDAKLKNVIFTAQNMDVIDSLKLAHAKKQEKQVEGVKRTYIEVTFPAKSDGQKTGWISADYISTKAQCAGVVIPKPQPIATPAPVRTEAKPEVKPADVVSKIADSSDEKIDILAPNCAEEKVLKAAKIEVRQVWGNRPRSGGKCAKGVRLSLQFSKIGEPPVSDGLGDAIDFLQALKAHGYVDSGLRDVKKAPAGAVIILGGPYTAGYLKNHRGPHTGNYVGHVTIKGDDGFFYTDAKEDHVAIGWVGTSNRSKVRNIYGIYVPGPQLIKKYAGQCARN